jgi:TrmH family RNA methyltransferase
VSLDNHYIKLAASLKQKKYREESGLFVVEGIRFVQEVLAASWILDYVVVAEEKCDNIKMQELLNKLEVLGCPVLMAPLKLYQKISDTESPQGILAVVRQKTKLLEELPRKGLSSLWVILDALQDPGNIGTIIRAADAAGAAGVILTSDCADLYAGKTARATMGSLFHIPVAKATSEQCIAFCAQRGLTLYVAGAEAATSYSKVRLTEPCAVVFGNEGAGVGETFRRSAQLALKIPIVGWAESINVSTAAAVILFEAARQREMAL